MTAVKPFGNDIASTEKFPRVNKMSSASSGKSKGQPELRILYIISALGMGGAETWIMSLLKN